MTRFAHLVESFNAGRIEEVVDNTTADYEYSDPMAGRLEGAAAHEVLMRQVLQRFPDRRIEILRCWSADNAEFAEYLWTGTPADGGPAVEMRLAAIVEFDGDRLRRFASFAA